MKKSQILVIGTINIYSLFCGSATQEFAYLIGFGLGSPSGLQSPWNSPGRLSASKFIEVAVGGPRWLSGGRGDISFLLHGSLHRAAHNIAACFSRREIPERKACMKVTKTEVTIILDANIKNGIPSFCSILFIKSQQLCLVYKGKGYTWVWTPGGQDS